MLCTIIQLKVAKLDETGAKATGETQKCVLNLDVETFIAKTAKYRVKNLCVKQVKKLEVQSSLRFGKNFSLSHSGARPRVERCENAFLTSEKS